MLRTESIQIALIDALTPTHLEVIDESHLHHVPAGAQTHYKVILVAQAFEGSTLVARHRVINKLLEKEFTSGLHALSLHLYTPAEWTRKQTPPAASPACRDGFAQ